LKRAEPASGAKFVEFVSAAQADTMPGLRSSVLDWPYVEGLRLDEAMHPLAMLVFGMYGELLPNRMAHRCDWLCPGNTDSRVRSRS